MGQLKLRAHVQVTLETGLGRLPRINDGPGRAAALDVQASGPWQASHPTLILCVGNCRLAIFCTTSCVVRLGFRRA